MDFSKKELERRSQIVTEDNNGCLPMHMPFFTSSIRYSANCALQSFNKYDNLLKEDVSGFELISEIQEAITHVGALSRFYWPSSMGKKDQFHAQKMARGKQLRNRYGISDDSPISDRKLRNAWEHFDEKLDIYLLTNDTGAFFPDPILNSHTLADDENGRVFKLLDIKNECLVLLGKKFFFKPIRDEVEGIFKIQ